MRAAPLALVALLSSLASAEPNRELQRAEQLLDALQYPAAAKALDAAAAVEGNDRATVLKILELQGICAGALNKQARATTAFQALLELDPQHALAGDWPPRVTTPFLQAKAWVSDHGALQFQTGESAPLVVLSKDPLHLVKGVRFHVRPADGSWSVQLVPLTDDRATVDANPGSQWWAELVGDRSTVLALAGSLAEPRVLPGMEPLPPPPTVAAPPSPPVTSPQVPWVPPPAPPPEVAAHPTPSLRPAAYTTAAVGVVLVGVGTAFGIRSQQERSQLTNVTYDSQGRVTSLTQQQAQALDQSRKDDALIANVMWVSGAALVAGGAVLWVWGSAVHVGATPGGAVAWGTFP